LDKIHLNHDYTLYILHLLKISLPNRLSGRKIDDRIEAEAFATSVLHKSEITLP
jgi:hypothetical protein